MLKRHKIIDTEYHSLYSKVIPEIRERYNHKKERYESMYAYEELLYRWHNFFEKKDKNILKAIVFNRIFFRKKPLFRVKRSQSERYRLYIGSFYSSQKDLHSLFYQLRESSASDRLELVINSHGGSVEEGRLFYNLIQEKFYDRTITYLDNHGYSMGATLFCMANKRVIYPYSNLMFHNYSSSTGGKGGEILAEVKHSDKLNTKFRHDIVVKQGFLSEEEFEKLLIGQDYWMASEELCMRGIATHVIVEGEKLTAEEYLKSKGKDKE